MCLQRRAPLRRVKRRGMAPPDIASPYTPEKDAGFCSGGEDDDSEESNRSNSDDSGLKMGCPTHFKRRPVAEAPEAPPKKRSRYARAAQPAPCARLPAPAPAPFSVDALLGAPLAPPPPPPPPAPPPREQRNYKNMTRERRIEANARERTRVHTISAAFDTLRQSIPAYSHNQKLSKLSVLRIACSYILALSRVAAGEGDDEAGPAGDTDGPSLAECVESVSKTIQTEGKLRKRRDDS